MKKNNKNTVDMEVIWRKEEKKKALTGETVLEMSFCWPETAGKNLKLVNRYYGRVKEEFCSRWERELYLRACMDLVNKREQVRTFSPWKAVLAGEVLWQDERCCSIVMQVKEFHGDCRALEYRWGDVWNKEDGCPVRLKESLSGGIGWRGNLSKSLVASMKALREQGIYLDPDGEKKVQKYVSLHNFALTQDEVILYCPQCAVAPAVEGVLEFRVPRPQLV